MTPTTKLISKINHTLRERIAEEPTCSPIGVMARSVPRVKSAIPRMSITVPITKAIRRLFGTGEIVKQRINTMQATGRTELSDSFAFSYKIVLFCLKIIIHLLIEHIVYI